MCLNNEKYNFCLNLFVHVQFCSARDYWNVCRCLDYSMYITNAWPLQYSPRYTSLSFPTLRGICVYSQCISDPTNLQLLVYRNKHRYLHSQQRDSRVAICTYCCLSEERTMICHTMTRKMHCSNMKQSVSDPHSSDKYGKKVSLGT